MRDRLRWALAPTDRRAKAAALLGALPLAVAVAALVGAHGGGVLAALLVGAAAAAAVIAGAIWLLAPRESSTSAARVGRVRAAQRELVLDVRATAPSRVNIVLPIIDVAHFFGGYIGLFNVARRLSDHGLRVRLVTADPQPRLPTTWRMELARYEGLADGLDRIEVAYGADGTPLEVSPDDAFVAASAWTAPVAHRAATALGRQRFVHVIQDYDALLFPNGSMAATAREAYRLPHYAIFSTEPLREYFRRRGLGVFEGGTERGERASVVFRSAITPVGPVTERDLAERRRNALLFYARPEEHAARNMFELGIVALGDALQGAVFSGGDWRFAGVGSMTPLPPVDLPGGARLELLQRSDQRAYAGTLRNFSVGLALMDTPHPSLVPIEMASAGMAVVTTTFENKDAATLTSISPNIIAVRPTPAAISAGLREAVRLAGDLPARVGGAAVDWPTTWDDALDDALVERVAGWLRER